LKILVYKGNYQYGVVDLFIDECIKYLKLKGEEVIECDLLKENAGRELQEIFSKHLIECVIGFNGFGVDIKINNSQSIYDAVNTVFLAVYVDHPAYQLNRCVEPIKNYLSCFNDRKHVEYLHKTLPSNHKISFFLPHGGFTSDKKINDIEEFKKAKEIDLFFAASFLGDGKKSWKENNHYLSDILDEVAELLIYDDYISTHEAFEKIFEKRTIKFSSISKVQLGKLYREMMKYVRGYKRITLINALIENDVNFVLCGKGWDNYISSLPKEKANKIDYRNDLDVNKTLELTEKSKVIINLSSILSNGSHERVFSGMLRQSLVFTDKSTYYDEEFNDMENILYYSFKDLNEGIDKLKQVLEDDEKLYQMTSDAYEIAVKNHTWENRVEKMLQMVKLSKDMDI
jgi:hypothetical protein